MKSDQAAIKTLSKVDELRQRGQYKMAQQTLNDLISDSTDSFDSLFARFYRARSYESGFFGKVDMQLAEEDYRYVVAKTDRLGVDPSIGLARVLLKSKIKSHYEEIVELCEYANSMNKNKRATILLGAADEFLTSNYSLASSYYLRAFFMGSKWGLPFYARVRFKDKRYVRALLSYALLVLMAPIFYFIDKSKYPII